MIDLLKLLRSPRSRSPDSVGYYCDAAADDGHDDVADDWTMRRMKIPVAGGNGGHGSCSVALQHLKHYGLTWLMWRMRYCFLENHGEILQRKERHLLLNCGLYEKMKE